MTENNIAAIESLLHGTHELNTAQREELQRLLETLRSELASVPSPGNSTALSAPQPARRPQSIHDAMEDLNSSVAGLEAQHPRLTELVNSISMILSNTGI